MKNPALWCLLVQWPSKHRFHAFKKNMTVYPFSFLLNSIHLHIFLITNARIVLRSWRFRKIYRFPMNWRLITNIPYLGVHFVWRAKCLVGGMKSRLAHRASLRRRLIDILTQNIAIAVVASGQTPIVFAIIIVDSGAAHVRGFLFHHLGKVSNVIAAKTNWIRIGWCVPVPCALCMSLGITYKSSGRLSMSAGVTSLISLNHISIAFLAIVFGSSNLALLPEAAKFCPTIPFPSIFLHGSWFIAHCSTFFLAKYASSQL